MKLALMALWCAEGMLDDDEASLAKIARKCGVTRHHLNRAFTTAFGKGPIGHLRSRRLTEAARSLAAGQATVTEAGLAAGYDAPSAFTRAFRAEFGCTPSSILRTRHIHDLPLTDPHKLETIMTYTLPAPRLETRASFRVCGLARRYAHDEVAGIPALWAEFAPRIHEVSDMRGSQTYGIRYGVEDDHFDYLASVEVGSNSEDGFKTRAIPGGQFAVFAIDGHVADLHRAMHSIFSEWLPESDFAYGDGLDFEQYDERFVPETGAGIVELWIPVSRRSETAP